MAKKVAVGGEAVSRGSLGFGTIAVEYYTTHPAPTQWVAVAVVTGNPGGGVALGSRQMLVGTGKTEVAAVAALQARVAAFHTTHAASPVIPPSLPEFMPNEAAPELGTESVG